MNSPKTSSPASFTSFIRLGSRKRVQAQTAISQPPPPSQLRGQARMARGRGLTSPTRRRAPQIGLGLLQAGRCTEETRPLPPAQAASLLLLLPRTPGDRKHQPDLLRTVGNPGSTSCFSREKRRNTQNLRLEEEDPEPNLQQVTFAESRGSSSHRSVHALHIALSLININKDLQFSGVLPLEDGS